MPKSTRRCFMKSSAALAAGIAVRGVPARAGSGANDRLRVAVVGLGGRWCSRFAGPSAGLPGNQYRRV
jgi:hypothetical protein